MEDKALISAQRVFQTVCKALDELGFRYEKDEENFTTKVLYTADDIPCNFALFLGKNWEFIEIVEFLPFTCEVGKFIDLAFAVSATNATLADGSFWLDITDGTSAFKLTSVYQDSLISTDLIKYMIEITLYTVDKYSEKLYNLTTNEITLQEYMDFLENS